MLTKIEPSDKQLLRNLIPLTTLSESKFNSLSSGVRIENGDKGLVLFRQGDNKSEFVYLLSGKVSLQAGDTEMDVIEGGTETSRFALAHQIPRKINAVAKSKIRFVRIQSDLLYSTEKEKKSGVAYRVTDLPEEASDDWMTTLLKSPIFQRLPASNLQKIIIELEEIEVAKDEQIIRQGEPGDYYYIIKNGRCVLTRKPTPNAKDIRLAQLKSCDTFGEDALISGNPRNVSISMLTPGALLRLKKEKFINLIKDPIINYLDYPAIEKEIEKEIEKGAILIDIRSPDEFERHHIEGSKNIPFFSLRMQLHSLDPRQRVFLVCEDGNSSEAAAFLLIRHKLDAVVLRGGLKAYSKTIEKNEALNISEPKPNTIAQDEIAVESTKQQPIRVNSENIAAETNKISTDVSPAVVRGTASVEASSRQSVAANTDSMAFESQLPSGITGSEERIMFEEKHTENLLKDQGEEPKRKPVKVNDSTASTTSVESEFRINGLGSRKSGGEDHGNGLDEEDKRDISEYKDIKSESSQKSTVEAKLVNTPIPDHSENIASNESIREELAELRREKKSFEKQVATLTRKNEELKTVVQEFIDRNGEQDTNEEISSLRTELEMIRSQAASDVSAMKHQLNIEQERILELQSELERERNKVIQLETDDSASINVNTNLTATDEDIFLPEQRSSADQATTPKSGFRSAFYAVIILCLFMGSIIAVGFGTKYGQNIIANLLANDEQAKWIKSVEDPKSVYSGIDENSETAGKNPAINSADTAPGIVMDDAEVVSDLFDESVDSSDKTVD